MHENRREKQFFLHKFVPESLLRLKRTDDMVLVLEGTEPINSEHFFRIFYVNHAALHKV